MYLTSCTISWLRWINRSVAEHKFQTCAGYTHKGWKVLNRLTEQNKRKSRYRCCINGLNERHSRPKEGCCVFLLSGNTPMTRNWAPWTRVLHLNSQQQRRPLALEFQKSFSRTCRETGRLSPPNSFLLSMLHYVKSSSLQCGRRQRSFPFLFLHLRSILSLVISFLLYVLSNPSKEGFAFRGTIDRQATCFFRLPKRQDIWRVRMIIRYLLPPLRFMSVSSILWNLTIMLTLFSWKFKTLITLWTPHSFAQD